MRKTIAIFMIFLILELPFLLAQEPTIVQHKISGSDGAADVVRQSDILSAEVILSAEALDPMQVWLGFVTSFDSCVQISPGRFKCNLFYPKSGTQTFEPENSYSINVHRIIPSTPPTANTFSDSRSGSLIIDEYPPVIQVSLQAAKVRDTLQAQIMVTDSSSVEGRCSGIRIISLSASGVTKTLDYEGQACRQDAAVSLNVTTLSEGQYTLSVSASDHARSGSAVQVPFTVDRTGTSFSDISLKDTAGHDIRYIANTPMQAVLSVRVSNDTTISTVRADLSALDLLGEGQRQAVCQTEGGKICSWNVVLSPSAIGIRTITLSAQDDIGNSRQEQVSLFIAKEVEGPKAVEIHTRIENDNKKYLATNDSITVVFLESGAGISPDQVFLDLTALGLSVTPAASCVESRCVWQISKNMPAGAYTVFVHPSTKDRLGNSLAQTYSATIIVDSQPPQLRKIGMAAADGSYGSYVTYGDSLLVTAEIFETGELADAVADFSSVISGASAVLADRCTREQENIWKCTWITDPIDSEGYSRTRVFFNFSDVIGNTARVEAELTVYDIQSSYSDHWLSKVTCSPGKIDKEVSSLIEQRLYCHVELQGQAMTISIALEDCTSEKGSDVYVKRQELMNDAAGSTDPYIKLTLQAANLEGDVFSLRCPLVILSATEREVTAVPEIEQVSIEIPMVNEHLGEYGSNVREKAEDAVDDATGSVWKTITTLRKVFFYAERICSLITTINTIGAVFNKLGLIKRTWAKTPTYASPALEASGMQDQSVTSYLNSQMKKQWIGADDGIGGFANKFCKFISCRMFYDEAWETKATKGIGNWQRTVLSYANLIATGGPVGENIGLGGEGVNAYTFKEGVEQRGGLSPKILLQGGKLNPKDSIVLSVATLCIPGIIYNLDKYRQIQCLYADCLTSSVETGVPISACEDLKDQAQCKYIYGEIFQLAPFAGLIDYASNLVRNALSSPFGVVNIAMGAVCSVPISTPFGGQVASICLFNEIAGMIADIWSDIANIKDDWKIKDDYCSGLGDKK